MIKFDHEKLDVYQAALEMVGWVEDLLGGVELTVSATDHLRRASESIVRNLVRANSKHSTADRARLIDVSYGSGLECAACLDVLFAWDETDVQQIIQGKTHLDRIVAMLIGLRSAKGRYVCEPQSKYTVGTEDQVESFFAHEELRVYQSSLRLVRWVAKVIRSESLGLPKGRDLDRHSTSVVLNIAEGNGKFSTVDRKRFLDIAMSSSLQAASTLDIFSARKLVSENIAQQGKEHIGEIVPMLVALSRSLE